MCPIFSRTAFAACLHTFKESKTGYGLDFVWPRLLDFKDIGIIDSVPVRHLRPVQSHKKLKRAGINPRKLIQQVAERFGSTRYRPKTIDYVHKEI
jgi:hypothetical protein